VFLCSQLPFWDTPMSKIPVPPNSVQCRTRSEWRAWLIAHHATAENVWLITFKKGSGEPILSYDDIVEEALCFGWVDSRPGKLDAKRTMLYISPRKPKSAWSKPNKIRIEKMTAAGQMYPAGIRAVELAKQNGTWSILDASEDYIPPDDLVQALDGNAKAKQNFAAFPPGVRKNILHWITLAKRPETRAKRIAETVALAAKNIRANQPRQPNPKGDA
jgi:uncharacterized protein YdeI (YjbR/CyaY-like superfamily)